MPSDRSYTNAFTQMANGIQREAESKLGRKLTETEANYIRNAGSLMMLESVGMGIQHAQSAEDISEEFAEAETAFSDRLAAARGDVKSALETKLNRRLAFAERQRVDEIPNCLAAMMAIHKIEDSAEIKNISDVLP